MHGFTQDDSDFKACTYCLLCVVDFTCALYVCVSTVRVSVCAVGIPACVECGSYSQVGRERG